MSFVEPLESRRLFCVLPHDESTTAAQLAEHAVPAAATTTTTASATSEAPTAAPAAALSAVGEINVRAKGAAAYELGPVTRFFYIRRGGDLSKPMTVRYMIGGKAKQGLDYNVVGDRVTIKAGNHLRRVEVTPILDEFIEDNESVTLTLLPDPAYGIAAAETAATIRIISVENTHVPEPQPPLGPTVNWSTVAAAQTKRSEAMVAVVNNRIWVFGGYLDATATNSGRVDWDDPAANQWQNVSTTMPTPASHGGAAVIGTDVFLAGGYTGGSGGGQTFAVNNVWRYDTVANTWHALPNLPSARGGGALVALNGLLHYMGGSDITRNDRAEHWSLDVAGGATEWTTRAPLVTVRNHVGGVALDGKIWLVGGQQDQDADEVPQPALEVYDPATNAWTSRASMPFGRSHIAAATTVWRGRIVTFGGETTYQTSVKNVSAYNPVTDTWSELSPLPGNRSSGVAAIVNDTVYYTGGLLATTTWKGTLG